jgi:hypothetical protein
MDVRWLGEEAALKKAFHTGSIIGKTGQEKLQFFGPKVPVLGLECPGIY